MRVVHTTARVLLLLICPVSAHADGVVSSGLQWRVQWAGCANETAEAAATCATAVFSGGGTECGVAGQPGPWPRFPYEWDNGRYSEDGRTFFFRIVHPCSGASPTDAQASLDACPPHSGAVGSRCICERDWTAVSTLAPPQCVPIVHLDLTAQPSPSCHANPGFGNPVFPATGAKRQVVRTGIMLSEVALDLLYDSTLLMQRRSTDSSAPGFDRPDLGAPGFGGAWRSTWHRRLVVDRSGSVVSIVREDGSVEVFRLDSNRTWRSLSTVLSGHLVTVGSGYRYTDARLVRMESYDADGKLVAIRSARGPSLTLHYSDAGTPQAVAPAAGHLIQVSEPTGRRVEFHYSTTAADPGAPVRLSTIVDPTGRAIRLDWSADARALAAITWQDESRIRLHAGSAVLPWALTGITDEADSVLATFEYDRSGRAVLTHRGGGLADRHVVDYGDAGPLDTFVDEYDASIGTVARVRRWAAAESSTTVRLPNDASSVLRFTSINGAVGLSSATQPAGSGCAASMALVGYDAAGRPSHHVDADGYRTCVSYDDFGRERVRIEGLPAAGADCEAISTSASLPAGARRITHAYHPAWALPIRVAEPGRITTKVYNGLPDPISGGVAHCAPPDATLPDGSPIAVLCRSLEQATSDDDGALGLSASPQPGVPPRERRWTYDDQGRILSEVDESGQATTYRRHSTTRFSGTGPDSTGQTAGDLQAVVNAVGHVTGYGLYDRRGQWLQATDPNGVVVTRSFDERARLTTQSQAGRVTRYGYWPTGKLQRITFPDGTGYRLGYDAAQRVTSIEDHLGNRVSYRLNSLGKVEQESVTGPDGRLLRDLQRQFDGLGRLQLLLGREP